MSPTSVIKDLWGQKQRGHEKREKGRVSKFSIIIFKFVTDIYRPDVTLLASHAWEIDPEPPNPIREKTGESAVELELNSSYMSEGFAFPPKDSNELPPP